MHPQRHLPRFCPLTDFAERYPDWTHHATDLHGIDEVIDVERHLLLVDPKDEGEAWAVAHTTAHLDLEHHRDRHASFTEEQERDASDLAELRLGTWKPLQAQTLDWIDEAPRIARDHDWSDIPLDGESTIQLR